VIYIYIKQYQNRLLPVPSMRCIQISRRIAMQYTKFSTLDSRCLPSTNTSRILSLHSCLMDILFSNRSFQFFFFPRVYPTPYVIIHKLPPTTPQIMSNVRIPAPALSAVVIFVVMPAGASVVPDPALGLDLLVPPVSFVTGTIPAFIRVAPRTESADI
jgi:hypothetical protein